MLNKLLLLLCIIILLHHQVCESSSCTDETHSLHGAAESFYALVIVELVFIVVGSYTIGFLVEQRADTVLRQRTLFAAVLFATFQVIFY